MNLICDKVDNYMKKISMISFTVLVLFFAFSTSVCAKEFSDLKNEHWAYNDISKLIENGTVTGYSDNTFRPENKVTRAEFVKMLGGTVKGNVCEYTDVIKEHWAYDYILNSGIKVDSAEFRPDEFITRCDAVYFMWQQDQYGSGSDMSAIKIPGVVLNQINSDKYINAVKWAYSKGIMNGDDGISLRLNDFLSRAEAASLINRAIAHKSVSNEKIADVMNESILSGIYEKLDIFDMPYKKDEPITNGEIMNAAARMLKNQYNLTLSSSNGYKYAPATEFVLEKIRSNTDDAEQIAGENSDRLSAAEIMTYAYIFSCDGSAYLGDTDDYYGDADKPETFIKNMVLTYANKNNLIFSFDGKMKGEEITKSDLSVLLLQLETLLPSARSISNGKVTHEKVSLSDFPYADRYVNAIPLSDLPSDVYKLKTGSFSDDDSLIMGYRYARDYSAAFEQIINEISTVMNNNGAEFYVRYYPTLISVSDNKTAFRVRVYCAKNDNVLKFSEIIGNSVRSDFVPAANTAYILDISVNKHFSSIYSDTVDKISIDDIIWSE